MADGYGFGYHSLDMLHSLLSELGVEQKIDIGVELDVLVIFNEFLM